MGPQWPSLRAIPTEQLKSFYLQHKQLVYVWHYVNLLKIISGGIENKHHNTGITVVYLIAGLMQDILIEMELIERRHGNENWNNR